MAQNQSSPSPRRSVPVAPANEEAVDKEVEELFKGRPASSAQPSLDDFIAKTARTKIAIVIPLFGYWTDMENGFLDEEVLDAATERARSYAHNVYIILVAEPQRLPPWSAKILNSKFVAGNVRGVPVPVGSTYGDYLRKGMQVAMQETDAAFFIFHSPWTVIQDHGVDAMVDRINIPDNAPVICGYEMHQKVSPDVFMRYTTPTPDERTLLNFNFFGANRFITEMCPLDPNIKTQIWLERDFFQSVASKGYTAVSSERVPMFSFAVPWAGVIEGNKVKQRPYVEPADYDHDKSIFLRKWKFLPDDVKSPKPSYQDKNEE